MISVLYIDDEPALLDIGKQFLEFTEGIQVTTLPSAQLALEELASRPYDAILSDYQMPEMDGIEFLKEVRQRFGEIPFILFTGKGREEIVIQAINNGADFYVQKGGEITSQFAELIHHIQIAIERRHAIDSLRDSEQRFADIIDFAPTPMFAIDTEGKVIIWNKAIEDLTGIPAADMLGRGNFEYALPFYGERRPLLIDLIREPGSRIGSNHYVLTKKERTFLTAESIITYPTGVPRYFESRVSLLYNEDHQIIGAIESIVDITGLKRTEEKLRDAYAKQTTILEELKTMMMNTKKKVMSSPAEK